MRKLLLLFGFCFALVNLEQEASAAACSAAKRASILEEPDHIVINVFGSPVVVITGTNTHVTIDCDITLSSSDVITKLVRFIGSDSDNVTFDCNGAQIFPLQPLITSHSIRVATKVTVVNGVEVYDRPENIEIKNCDVYGTVRIHGSGYNPNDLNNYSNNAGPAWVLDVRNTSPRNVVFDNVDITNYWHKDALYFGEGVTHITYKNSRIYNQTQGVAVYFGFESANNTLENNEIYNRSSNDREIVAVDASEYNVITRNWLDGVNNGGIYLYRNCGEGGSIKYTGPRYNEISDNILYYNKYNGSNPGIYVGERTGENIGFCNLDSGWSWDISDVPTGLGWDSDWESSSSDDRDFARFNDVDGNRFCNRNPNSYITVKVPTHNHSNVVSGNTTLNCPTSNPIPR